MAEYYRSLPPVIKFYGSACLVTTIAVQLGVLDPVYLDFNPKLAFKHLQLWRVVTNFFVLGQIQLMMLGRYGVQLEKTMRTAQFVWMLILATFTLLVLAMVIPILTSTYMGPTIVLMLMYLWSREFPTESVSIMGLLRMQGYYLPWAMLVLNTILGSSVLRELLGIAMGHGYYFLTVLHPRAGGKDYLQAPRFLQKLLTKWDQDVPQGERVHLQQASSSPTTLVSEAIVN